MLDEKDLQLIAKMNQESEKRMMVMMEAYFEPKFNLLAEKMDLLEQKMVPADALEDAEDRLDVLEAAVRRHSREIEKLKKAQ